MTMHILGKKTLIGVPKLLSYGSAMGAEMLYTKPSLDGFYSKHGFAYPLDYEGVPYALLMEGVVPMATRDLITPKRPLKYILVDHAGQVWKIVITIEDNGTQSFYAYHVDTTTDGWWLTKGPEVEIDADLQLFLGFLCNEPTPKKIDAFWYKHHHGFSFIWLKIPDIVKTLREFYPKSRRNRMADKILEDLKPNPK
jgi:hypothetical protein